MSERKPGWHTEGGDHSSVSCAESIYGLTYTDFPCVGEANSVNTQTRLFYWNPLNYSFGRLRWSAGSESLSASETTKGKIMPCLRGETRARKGDLFSSAARQNSQPVDRFNLTEAVCKPPNHIYERSGEAGERLIAETPLRYVARFSHNERNIARPTFRKYTATC